MSDSIRSAKVVPVLSVMSGASWARKDEAIESYRGTMSSNDRIAAVYIHREARDEAEHHGQTCQDLAATLASAWGRLRTTRGSKLRALSHTPGREFRLRLADVRAVFTTVTRLDGTLAAFIHLVEHRARAYAIDAFLARIGHFHQHVLAAAKTGAAADQIAQYSAERLDSMATNSSDAAEGVIEYALFSPQQRFFNRVLPFGSAGARGEPRLVVGEGPPGSGKTIVGQQLMREARALGYEVDVLVPSVSLEKEYRDYASGLIQSGDVGSLRVHRFDQFFATSAGLSVGGDREVAFNAWWKSTIEKPRLQPLLSRAGMEANDLKVLLRTVADALLQDEIWGKSRRADSSAQRIPSRGGRRDFLGSDFERLEAALFLLSPALLQDLEGANDEKLQVATRAHLATEAEKRSASRSGQRLILVDEAQDLAPAEWRALMSIAFDPEKCVSQSRDVDWRVVLLGDMRQRVSLVPFDWAEITRYVIEQKRWLPDGDVLKGPVDQASYRMRREIGLAAQSVFAPELLGGERHRQHGALDLDALQAGGEVTVIVSETDWTLLAEATKRLALDVANDEHLIIVHQESGLRDQWRGQPAVIADSVRGAKGLEYDSVVVLLRPEWKAGREGRSLTGDEATELYTAISRARDRVLAIVPPQLWDRLRTADPWNRLPVHRQPSDEHLCQLLERHRVQLSPERLLEVLLTGIERLCTETDAESAWLERLCDRLDRLTAIAGLDALDAAFSLIGTGEQLLHVSAARYETLQKEVEAKREALPPRIVCALLLLLGETALAHEFAQRSAHTADIGPWDVEALEIMAHDSPTQRALINVARTGVAFEWTADRYEQDLLRAVQVQVRAIRA